MQLRNRWFAIISQRVELEADDVGSEGAARHGGSTAAADVCGNLVAHRPATGAARSGMTATVSDETDDEGRGVPGMKQSHEFRTRKASNPNDWLRTRLVAPEFHCGVPR
jgi:hypothetical protein